MKVIDRIEVYSLEVGDRVIIRGSEYVINSMFPTGSGYIIHLLDEWSEFKSIEVSDTDTLPCIVLDSPDYEE
jgi:hypothetical protein